MQDRNIHDDTSPITSRGFYVTLSLLYMRTVSIAAIQSQEIEEREKITVFQCNLEITIIALEMVLETCKVWLKMFLDA